MDAGTGRVAFRHTLVCFTYHLLLVSPGDGRHGHETHRDPCLHFIACWCENKPSKSDLREKGLISLMIPGYSPSLWGSHSVGIQSCRHVTPTVESQKEQMKTSLSQLCSPGSLPRGWCRHSGQVVPPIWEILH